jgi:hypothetical protein
MDRASNLQRARDGKTIEALPPEAVTPRPPPLSSRPKTALVVSPISLTEEELALPKGARPKMPTLLGLGAALGEPSLPLEGPASDDEGLYDDVSPIETAAAGVARRQGPGSGDVPHGFAATLELLTDFVLKLSLGPLSLLWVDDARRAAELLRALAMRRQQSALTLLSGRLEQALDSLATEDVLSPAPVAVPDLVGTGGAVAAPGVAAVTAPAGGTSTTEASSGVAPADPQIAAPVTAELTSSAGVVSEAAVSTDAVSTDDAVSAQTVSRVKPTGQPTAMASDAPNGSARRCIDGGAREQILRTLGELPALLPEWPEHARNLARETRRREQRLVRELLAVVDGLNPERRTRMTRQMRLDQLISATPETLARAFDAPLERARELNRILAAYRAERQTQPPDVGNWLGLTQALNELSRTANEFDDCDEEERKEQRLARQRRRQASTRVDLLLAERGELDLLGALEPCCVSERIERLRAWLASETERRSQG